MATATDIRGASSRTFAQGLTVVLALLGAVGLGSVAVQAQTYRVRVLHKFSGKDGANPYVGNLVGDAAGNLYGATATGGNYGFGTVFKLNSSGKLTVLYNFAGGTDGATPLAGLTRDPSGGLYGTTTWGGGSGCTDQQGCGTVFKVGENGAETVLHRFTGAGGDGANPGGSLVEDAKGNLYGTAQYGGSSGCTGGLACGIVFKLDASGNETVLYTFTGGGGAFPESALILDGGGNLYGTTYEGGDFNQGTVFKLDSSGKETLLYSFTGVDGDGRNPVSALTRDPTGDLYGATNDGGGSGYGTVFKLSPTGEETVLHNFAGPPGAEYPDAALFRDAKGNLYGTTFAGGPSGDGIVFRVTKSGRETTLHSFVGSDGAYVYSGLIQDKKGDFYGTTYEGGDLNCNPPYGCGTVFELIPR